MKKDWTVKEWNAFIAFLHECPVHRLVSLEKQVLKEMVRRVYVGGLTRDENDLLKPRLEVHPND